MKKKIKRTIYFTNHPKVLKRLERFSKEHKLTLSATILGFCALGMMYEDTEKFWRDNNALRRNVKCGNG
jgi:hypothetical protein